MKTKSLVLGAHPPFEGPWVSLEGAEKWEAVVTGPEKAVTIHARRNGGPLKTLLFDGEVIEAVDVRVLLDEAFAEELVTVLINSI